MSAAERREHEDATCKMVGSPFLLAISRPADVTEVHRLWWGVRIARQQETDASIAARADIKCLYDKP